MIQNRSKPTIVNENWESSWLKEGERKGRLDEDPWLINLQAILRIEQKYDTIKIQMKRKRGLWTVNVSARRKMRWSPWFGQTNSCVALFKREKLIRKVWTQEIIQITNENTSMNL